MKKYIILLLIILGFQLNSKAQNCDEIFTIYFVRHAEKDLSSNDYLDPPLTSCGEERAVHLSKFFKDISLEAIYSTNYNRTQSTALPIAKEKKLDIEEYSTDNLDAFVQFLIKKKENALVVGHNHTTAFLAGLLAKETLGPIDLDTYNRIYQVIIFKNSRKIQLFHTSFECM